MSFIINIHFLEKLTSHLFKLVILSSGRYFASIDQSEVFMSGEILGAISWRYLPS